MPSKTTKLIMQIPQTRIEKATLPSPPPPPPLPKNKRNKKDQNKIVTAIVGDSMNKDVYGWKLSDREEKVVEKHFSESTTENMKSYIQPPLKRDPDWVIIHIGTNDLRSSQDPETIAKNIIDIAKNSTINKNEILVSSPVLRRDNLNSKGRQVNNILQKTVLKTILSMWIMTTLSHDNIAIMGVNTAGSKIFAENFILALSRQTWLGVIRDNDALIGNVSETESNSKTNKYLPEDSLESKNDDHGNGENIFFPLLKKI